MVRLKIGAEAGIVRELNPSLRTLTETLSRREYQALAQCSSQCSMELGDSFMQTGDMFGLDAYR